MNSGVREVTSFQKNHAVINELIRPHNYYVIVADIISVSNECYSRNSSCVLTWISPCLFYIYISEISGTYEVQYSNVDFCL